MDNINSVRWYPDSLTAWEAINEAFIKADDENLGFVYKGKALYTYDLVIGISNPKLPNDFDFGRHFNYTISKWKSLVGNYLDREELESIAKEITEEENNNSRSYNLALQFDNKHGHGKNCLLSMVFSRRYGVKNPNICVFLRASEITKRLVCDLLLFQRIGEYVYSNTKFTLTIHINQTFNDDTVLLMYHAHKDISRILSTSTNKSRRAILIDRLEYLLSCEVGEIKYKVHKRALKVLRPELFTYPKTLVRDCRL